MDPYSSLVEISKLLLREEAAADTASTLFRHVVDLTRAERGFLVVREDGSFVRRFSLRFDRGEVSNDEHRFSRSLVRRAIETGESLVSQDILRDPRLSDAESVEHVGPRAVLVAPLAADGEVYGVVYLDKGAQGDGFPESAVRFLRDFAELAGLFIHRAVEREALAARSASLERDLFSQHDFSGIVTQDPAMLRLLKMVAQVAASDATVLVRGETGTGKDLIARALHVNSPRRAKPFVALHCTALPSTLLESELFGHVRGAFTGADRDRAGRLSSAHGGTLFLDEIAEFPPEVQTKLLRFLQSGEIQRLGSDRIVEVDVRVVAATHRDLRALVDAGAFREDLYFRLKVIELELPPLRARPGDVPLLMQSFLERSWKREGRPRFSPRALELLGRYAFPGNVRELAHVVERACVLASGPDIDVDVMPAEIVATSEQAQGPLELTHRGFESAREAALLRAERDFLARLMDQAGGNVSLASRTSGIHRTYLQRLVGKHGLRSG